MLYLNVEIWSWNNSFIYVILLVMFKIELDELEDWASRGEAFLSGTAAVLSPVGTMLKGSSEIIFGDGQPGANTLRLRERLVAIQNGTESDTYAWRTSVRS